MTTDPKSEYPANSKKEKPKVEKVISGEAKARKQSVGKKLSEAITGDDAKSVGSYILFDVIVPAAKAMVADAASQGVERWLFGDSRPNASRRSGGGYTSYNRMYGGPQTSSRPGESRPRDLSRRARASHDFDEVILESRGEAEEVIDQLGVLVDTYGVATVSDMYQLVGITGSFTDDKWGWTDLRGATVARVRAGYLLNLPRPVALD